MIHNYALIAEYEYDDENGEYAIPSLREVIWDIRGNRGRLSLKETHFEVAPGTLHDTFGVPELK